MEKIKSILMDLTAKKALWYNCACTIGVILTLHHLNEVVFNPKSFMGFIQFPILLVALVFFVKLFYISLSVFKSKVGGKNG